MHTIQVGYLKSYGSSGAGWPNQNCLDYPHHLQTELEVPSPGSNPGGGGHFIPDRGWHGELRIPYEGGVWCSICSGCEGYRYSYGMDTKSGEGHCRDSRVNGECVHWLNFYRYFHQSWVNIGREILLEESYMTSFLWDGILTGGTITMSDTKGKQYVITLQPVLT